jgi:hypothetical protein
MPYVRPNFKSKAEVKRAIARGERIPVWQYNNIFNVTFEAGETVYLEGPWYPQPHRWYGKAKLGDDLCIDSIK